MTVHKFPVRVYYENTDAGSVVYHAEYLGFAERARTEMFRDHGFEHADMLKRTGIAFAVRHLDIDFQKPAVLDDLLTIESSITRIGGASMDYKQIVKREDDVLAELKVVLVCMDIASFSARRIPDEIRHGFKDLLDTRGEN